MQCKNINAVPILNHLAKCPHGGTWYEGFPHSVLHAMPAGTPPKLALAKMRNLIRRGLVDGCGCGCHGGFMLTEKGRGYLATWLVGVVERFENG